MTETPTQEHYEEKKAQELRDAEALVERIRTSSDPCVRYRDVRPITDLKHMLKTSTELYADRPAFHVKDSHDAPYRSIPYRQLAADVDGLGTALISLGLKGKRIAVIGENSYEWSVAYLAVICGTGVVVPLDRELTAGEIETLLIASEAEAVFYTKKFRAMFQEIRAGGKTGLSTLINASATESTADEYAQKALVETGRRLLAEGRRDFMEARIDRDAMSALLFTSGTTGKAKGVMLSHGNLVTGLMIPPTVLHVEKTDVFFSILPIHHSYECTCGFLIPLYRGASIAYCEGLKYIVKNLAEAQPTIMLSVPLILESLYRKIWQNVRKSGKEKLLRRVIRVNRKTGKAGLDLGKLFFKQITALFGGRMKIVICGGAAIDPAILQGIRDFGVNAVQGYGLTECAPICALNPDVGMKDDAAGYLIPGFDGRIDDPDPETGIGEICVKGDNVMLGYYGDPEETARVLVDGWFHTGDLGYIDEDRFVHITGRKKNVIITRNGKNVYPEELEYLLGRCELVSECMVWGRENEKNGEISIVAGIHPDEEAVREALGESWTEDALQRRLQEEVDAINSELAPFKQIRRIVLRNEEFEKTTGRKIKRFIESNREE